MVGWFEKERAGYGRERRGGSGPVGAGVVVVSGVWVRWDGMGSVVLGWGS